MSLQNNFPKERKFYFWAILMCHLVQIDDSIPEKDRKLFGTLAYRMISKAAQSVPDDPVRSYLSFCWLLRNLYSFIERIAEPS